MSAKTEVKRYIWLNGRRGDVRGYIRRSIFTGFLSSHDSYAAAISARPRRQIYSDEGYFLIPQRAQISPSLCRFRGEITGVGGGVLRRNLNWTVRRSSPS